MDKEIPNHSPFSNPSGQPSPHGPLIALLVSMVFFGAGYFISIRGYGIWPILAYMLILWGVMGMAYSLVELVRALRKG